MTVRDHLRRLGWRIAPERMSNRARQYESGLRERTGLTDLARRFVSEHGDRVLHGPVTGLRLPVDRLAEIDLPVARLLGSYESELHQPLERAIATSPPLVIDVGAADGYYAVGLALATGGPVIGYDASESARDMCRQTAQLNDVEIDLRGLAEPEAFEGIPDGALVLCDIDGAEGRLFTERAAAALRHAIVIVEMHEKALPGIRRQLRDLFGGSHRMEVVEVANRDPDAYPEIADYSEQYRDLAVNERRFRTDGLAWAVCWPA